MSDIRAAGVAASAEGAPPFARSADDVLAAAGSDAGSGLSASEAAARLASHGPNAITAEKPPSPWAIAAVQLRDPMNIMLVAVTVVSLLIGEVSTGVIVGAADRAERRPRHAAGAHGPGQRRRPVQDAGAAGPGCTRRRGPLGPGVRRRSWRHRLGRGRRHRARRRPDRTVGDPRGPGGGADWRERADRQGCGGAGVSRRRARRPDEHAVPEHLRDPRHRHHGRHGDGHADPDGPDRDDADARSRGRGRRCRRSSTR